jgi:hypothetical protein
MHKDVGGRKITGRVASGKAIVSGAIERGGKIPLRVDRRSDRFEVKDGGS